MSRTCRTQYSGSVTSPDAAIGIRGWAKSRVRTTARNSSSIGSIKGEWNACDTLNRFVFAKRSAMSNAVRSSPAITTALGPFTAAIETLSVRSGRTSASDAWIAIIAPPGGKACIKLARAPTNLHASSSDNTPATCAAAISPIE
ncbi:hypothetical protein Lesp02_07230 [Lentzea sp. NBRC 105346]|nr:hypothetical protein Lesp02_07230 [Lentzea sp. NBRC 105346]